MSSHPVRLTDAELSAFAADLVTQHGVPGAAVGVFLDGDVHVGVAGVGSLRTRARVTPDTVFQVGSITKVATALLVLQLVDRGRLELDAPLRRYLPDLQLGDRAAREVMTARQVLSHTCGLEGDHFIDFGWGPDTIERYVSSLADVGQIHPPGRHFSYCNTGYVLAGHLIEVLTGSTWNDVLDQEILTRGGLSQSGSRPEQALNRDAAVGHLPGTDGDLGVAPVWAAFPSSAPSGSTMFCSPAELLALGAILLQSGKALNGEAVVSPEASEAMVTPQVTVPSRPYVKGRWGLGVSIEDWGGTTVLGHDGGTPMGHIAAIRMVPDRQLAVCAMANSLTSAPLVSSALDRLLVEHSELRRPTVPAALPQECREDSAHFAGRYIRLGNELRVTAGTGGTLVVTEAGLGGSHTYQLEPTSGQCFRYINEHGLPDLAVFESGGKGENDYLHFSRIHRRVRTE